MGQADIAASIIRWAELPAAQGDLAGLRKRYDTDVDKLQASLASERCAIATIRAERERALQVRELSGRLYRPSGRSTRSG